MPAAGKTGVIVSGWFHLQIVHTGRLPLFCFFVAFVASFVCIRLSVRLIRAKVRWWPGNFRAGSLHVHHMVFGVVLMGVGGIAQLAAPQHSLVWRSIPAGVFGVGTALVLDEFALILHLRDVYWSNEGRLSIDAVFAAELFRVHLFTLFLGMWHYCSMAQTAATITGTGKGFGEGRL